MTRWNLSMSRCKLAGETRPSRESIATFERERERVSAAECAERKKEGKYTRAGKSDVHLELSQNKSNLPLRASARGRAIRTSNKFRRMVWAVHRRKLLVGSDTHACANRKSRQPVCRRAPTFASQRTYHSRVAEREIQFVAVTSIEGFPVATCRLAYIAASPSSLRIKGDGNSIPMRAERVPQSKQETSPQLVKFVRISRHA